MNFSDTIAAVATGNLISAIGIVRVSGADALTAADKIFRASCGIKLQDAQERRMYYGELTDAQGTLIDLCLCMMSRGPNTYTGEDTVEFHCHGSPVVLSEALRALFAAGVRQAEAGEFTKRAFLNGRMDLSQAEAIIDLIEAETPLAAMNAAGQIQGAICSKMNAIYDKLIDIMAHFHAVIDYPDEDIDEFKMSGYTRALRESVAELRRLLGTHERGKVLLSGIPTAIVGRVNTGKSSLFNALLGYERAIVTDIAGTTRDTIEEKVLIGGMLLRLIDTAGLRKTEDTIEKLGLERTLAALSGASLALVVLDGSVPLCEDDYKVMEAIPEGVPAIVVVNKCDLPVCHGDGSRDTPDVLTSTGRHSLPGCVTRTVPVTHLSALTGEGLDLLEAAIRELFPDFDNAPSGEIITSARQAEAIGRAAQSLEHAAAALEGKVSPDAILMDVEAALSAIGEVTGKTIREDIISRIFERFCVGK